MLILDDCASLLTKLRINIRKYDVVPATTLDEAIESLRKRAISFIVADIKLGQGKIGYEIFNYLFSTGTYAPGIVFTGYVVQSETKEKLRMMGISVIIEKGAKGRLSSLIEDAATRILASHEERLSVLTAKTRNLGLGKWMIDYGTEKRTIDDWLTDMNAGKYSLDKEKMLIDLMVQACSRYMSGDAGQPSPFPHLGERD